MRIAVNTRFLLKGRLEGIGWYTAQILQRMVAAHPEDQFIFFFDRPYDASFIYGPNVTAVVVPPPARHPVLYYVWYELRLPRLLRKYRADVFLSPDCLTSLRTKVPSCVVIHDLAFEHYPAQINGPQLKYLRWNTPRAVQKVQQVITVSEYSRQDIVQRYNVSPEKITVTYNGANDAYKPLPVEAQQKVREEFTGGNEYFLFVGALHPRKNVLNLLKAFVKFKKHHRSSMKLVIVGRLGWKFDALLDYRQAMPFKDEVVWLGYQDVESLTRLTAAAYAAVYPSLFEGFGIPILEALVCNTPVITSNTSSMPEVGGEAALLCDPTNVEEIAQQMGRMYKDEMLRDRLIKAAPAQAAKFSWDASAAILYNELKSAAGMH